MVGWVVGCRRFAIYLYWESIVQMGWSSSRPGRSWHIAVIVERPGLRDGPGNDGISREFCSYRHSPVLVAGRDTCGVWQSWTARIRDVSWKLGIRRGKHPAATAVPGTLGQSVSKAQPSSSTTRKLQSPPNLRFSAFRCVPLTPLTPLICNTVE